MRPSPAASNVLLFSKRDAHFAPPTSPWLGMGEGNLHDISEDFSVADIPVSLDWTGSTVALPNICRNYLKREAVAFGVDKGAALSIADRIKKTRPVRSLSWPVCR
jgi:hypothetical protein